MRELVAGVRRIIVLLGGGSSEREISLRSGRAVTCALASLGYAVRPLDPLEESVERFRWQLGDFAFIALHGRFGEDGQVQKILERRGIPYTGSGPAASRLAFSKSAAKVEFRNHGISTPRGLVVQASRSREELRSLAESVGFPLVVKPDQEGSSLGVSFVAAADGVIAACERAFSFGPVVLIEQAIVGTEWTVGLLDDRPLPPLKVTVPGQIFDFDDKYGRETTGYDFDGGVTSGERDRIAALAARAAGSLGAVGLSRVDIRVDRSGQPFVLEVNTVPGLTDHSLVPKAAERAGWTLGTLCEETMRLALQGNPVPQIVSSPYDRWPDVADRRAG